MRKKGLGCCLMMGGTAVIGLLLGLRSYVILAVGLFGCLLVPLWLAIQKRVCDQQEQYYEMTVYMELLLCSFKRTGHIKMALQDCLSAFRSDSRIAEMLETAIHILETGENVGEESIAESALNGIAKFYNSRRLNLLHHFVCRIEQKGGDAVETLDILLTDLEMWKRRIVLYHKRKNMIGRECVLAFILALLLCILSHFLIAGNLRAEFEGSICYQISTSVVLCAMLGSMTVIRYWLGLSHSEQNGSKNLSKEVEREFPYWLLSVTLYLQQDSLFHALEESGRETKGRFRKEVQQLREDIYAAPNSLEPYMNFFRELDLPELQTGMKMLYAVTSNGYPDTQRQIHFLVEQNFLVMDRYEQNFFQTRLAGLGMLRQIPMMLAGAKIVVDMLTFFMLFFADQTSIFSV